MTATEMNGGAPEQMRAAVLRDWNRLEVEEVPTPQFGAGEVLVRVRACGICGTDLKLVSGGFAGRWPPSLPFIIGHEWAGEVIAIGLGLEYSELRPGDRVAAENHTGCGLCDRCRAGRYNVCERASRPGFPLYGHTAQGALAEYAVRPAVVLHRLPPEVSDEAGALVNQGAMAVHAIRRTGLDPGAEIAVFGPGLLGMLTALVGRASGAGRVILVGRGERLQLGAKMGFTPVDYERSDPGEAIREITGGRGVERVYDCTGDPQVLGQALESVRRGGRVALLGLSGGGVAELAPDSLVLDEIDVMGIRSSPNCYPAIIELMRSGAIDVTPLTDDVYPLADVDAAFAGLRERRSIRPILLP